MIRKEGFQKMNWRGRYLNYNAGKFRKDLISGCIVGIIAIPLGMAFSIASGVKPEYGLYTTIIAGILISLLGGSKFQIGGPTGAFIPILLAVVLQYGYENLLIAGFLAGIILVLMGVFRLGALIRYIPRPVTIGFTAGIAVTIFSGQIGNFLGLRGLERHEYFYYNMAEIVKHISSINIYSIITAGICLTALLITPKYLPKVPASLVGILLSTAASIWLFPGKVTTIGSSYGAIPGGLPQLHSLDLSLSNISSMLQPALIIAMLGGIESLLSAVVADGMTNSRHNSNRELIGQGVANIVAPLFGGIPATGAIARTATNIKNGAVSPISGIIHGVVVLLIVVLFAPYASNIPLASMAPILMMVAWNMSERKSFAAMYKTRSGDTIILLVTFLLTVFTTLTTAVEVGLILAVILFVKRMSEALKINQVLPDHSRLHDKVEAHVVTEDHNCPQIGIFNVEGPLFFGASGPFEDSHLHSAGHKIIIIRMGKVPFMDTTGEANFASLVKKLQASGIKLAVTDIQPQPLALLQRTGCYKLIGEEQFYKHTSDALAYALSQIKRKTCLGCEHFAFRECKALSSTQEADHKVAVRGAEVVTPS